MKPTATEPSPRRHRDFSTVEILESRIAPASIIVSNTSNDAAKANSLPWAIAQANLPHTGIDTIVFQMPAPPLHSENMITLAATLTSTGNVNIVGPGAGKLIINGAGKYQIFNFNDNASTDSPVTISGLSLIDGAGTNGGAIYSTESLTLKNMVISGNGAGNGGGVDVVGGTHVVISSSLITGNTAQGYGGGLSLSGLTTASITNSVVTGNLAKLGCGGIYVGVGGTGASMTITGCQVSGNTASYGGGMYLKDSNTAATSKITVSATRITGNSATDATSLRGGGGLYIRSGNAVITGSTIENNTSIYQGGGLDAYGFASLTVSSSTISGNKTTGTTGTPYAGGGGVFVMGASATPLQPVKITGSHISDNQSARNGGGVYAIDGVALSISTSTISGNNALGTGGGIGTYGEGTKQVSLSVTGTTVSGNSAFNGGGIYGGPGNKAGVAGPASIISSKITGNASSGGGGGIFITHSSSVTIKTSAITGNSGAYDGGISLATVQSFHISGSTVTGNSAGTYAGGIDCFDSTGSILSTTISGNAAGTKGGGVYESGTSAVTLQIAKVTGNTAPIGPDIFGTFTYA